MEEKVFFNPGEKVKVKHDIDNVPTMYVVEKITRSYTKDDKQLTIFKGIKCRWFDKNHILHEAIFSSKDITHI